MKLFVLSLLALAAQPFYAQEDCPPLTFDDQPSEYNLGCLETVPYIEPVMGDMVGEVDLTYVDLNECDNTSPVTCDFTTYTQGGWGSVANGNNPGSYRDANFAGAFPDGLTIGCEGGFTLTLTSSLAVQNFLPSGSTPRALNASYTDPGNSYRNVLAGQLVAVVLALGFDDYDPNFSGSSADFGNQIIGSGTFEGMTISELVAIANEVIGGCSDAYSYSDLNGALTAINENFDGGSNNGFISCVEVVYTCACVQHRVWTATDACGNTATFDQYFIVGDDQGPVADSDPMDMTIECADAIPAVPVVTFTEDCSETLETSYSEEIVDLNGSEECGYQIVRTWTATDGCNTTVVDQIITVSDNTAPVFVNLPVDATVECGNLPETFEVSATDNCDQEVSVVISFEDNGSGCSQSRTFTFTAVDACGNAAMATVIYTVYDNSAPVLIGLPEDIAVSCDAIPSAAAVTAEDNCDGLVEVAFSEEISEGCPYTITRTWSATDDCGNTSSASQIISVSDNENPVLYGIPEDLTLECTDIIPTYDVWALDNCTTDLIVALTAQTIPSECGYTFVRTWYVEDACGNSATEGQTITVIDNSAPVLINEIPSELTISCTDEVPSFTPEFSDNCDTDLSISGISGLNNQSACGYDIERSWTATDDCGNSTTISQVIHVIDNEAPVLSGVPADATVECGDLGEPAEVSASDNCSVATVEFDEEISGDGCPYTVTRTWTATDACGNTSSASQIITVSDTEAPVLVNNPAIEIFSNCGEEIPSDEPVFADNCNEDLTIDYSELAVSGGCPGAIIRTWVVSDDCGNEVVFEQYVTINDTQAPVLSGDLAAELSVQCDEELPSANPEFADNCDTELSVEFDEEITQINACAYDVVRTWTVTDDCENASVFTQTIHVSDDEAPVLYGVPADVVLQCNQPTPEAVVFALDNCDTEVVVSLDAQTEYLTCGSVLTRTWTATDDCGNVAVSTQVITFEDGEGPVLTSILPAELSIECTDEAPVFEPSFEDNCSEFEVSAISGISNQSDCGYDIERSWTATDACGNATTVSQVIHVVDTTNPVLVDLPENITVSCGELPAPAMVSATDNCSVPTITMDQTSEGSCPVVITRTWTATDACGNQVSGSQTITVVDEEEPYLVNEAPEYYQIECGSIEDVNAPVFADNCDSDLDITFEELNTSGGCPGSVIRVYTATDNCGNTTTFEQYISFIDSTSPSVVEGVEAEVTINCGEAEPNASPMFADACDTELSIESSSEVVVSETCGYDIVKTWTATDDCENSTSVTQTIHVVDNVDPIISSVMEDLTVSCEMPVPAPAEISASDNCDDELTIEYTEEEMVMDCGSTIIRTWRAIDDCGNMAVINQNVYIVDETSPVIEGVPADITIECNQELPLPVEPILSDNCDLEIALDVQDQLQQEECGYSILRVYTAMDDCGNTNTVTQVITVLDTQSPVIEGPADITVSCGEIPAESEVSVSDNCDTDIAVSYNETIGEGCPYTIVRHWIATDDCNNSAEFTQVITVVDETAPVFEAFEEFVFVECDEVASYLLPATDNCDSDVEVEVTEESEVSGECYGSLLRTYTATDNCGNSSTAFQIVNIVDNTSPVLMNMPENLSLLCGEEIPAASADVYATDNCDSNVALVYSEVVTGEGCPSEIVRTWTATDLCGNSTSASQIITIASDVQLQSAGSLMKVVTYPNPADQFFTVKVMVPSTDAVSLSLYDMTGRMVETIFAGTLEGGHEYQWTYDSNKLGSGSYTLRVMTSGEVINKSIQVVNR